MQTFHHIKEIYLSQRKSRNRYNHYESKWIWEEWLKVVSQYAQMIQNWNLNTEFRLRSYPENYTEMSFPALLNISFIQLSPLLSLLHPQNLCLPVSVSVSLCIYKYGGRWKSKPRLYKPKILWTEIKT